MTLIPELVWEVGALLGEGPAWFGAGKILRFVDINLGMLHSFHSATGARESITIGGRPSFVVGADDGGLLVGSRNTIFRLEDESYGEPIVIVDQPAHNRLNDATVDYQGRLWLGTMDDEEVRESGSLYYLEAGKLHRFGRSAVVTNGPAVSADGQVLFWCDSPNRRVWREPLDGSASEGRTELFLQLADDEGYPDGIVLDSEDCLWVALWDGWGLRRYAPDGKMMLQVDLPCARVTKVAFGGPDLLTAYVTTARAGLGKADLAAQPLAGSLFAFDAPAPGRQLPSVRL